MTPALLALALLCPGHADLAPHVEAAAAYYALPPVVLVAMLRVEAHCRMGAVGNRGERCAMQLHGRARNGLSNKQLAKPRMCIMAGARWLHMMRAWCGGDLRCGLAAYNTGDRCKGGKATKKCRAGRRYARKVLGTVEKVRREMQKRKGTRT